MIVTFVQRLVEEEAWLGMLTEGRDLNLLLEMQNFFSEESGELRKGCPFVGEEEGLRSEQGEEGSGVDLT